MMFLKRAIGRFVCLLALFLALLLPVGVNAQSASHNEIDPIFDRQQWVHRVLVITGPEDDPLYLEQFELLEGEIDGLEVRDIVVVRHEDETLDKVEGLDSFGFRNRVIRDAEERRYLQNRLKTDDDVFSVVLVGLDGEVKQVWGSVVAPQEIFDAVDAMPIRAREIEEEKKTIYQIRKERRDARKAERYLGSRNKD